MKLRRALVGAALVAPMVVGGFVLASDASDAPGSAGGAQAALPEVVVAEVVTRSLSESAEFTGTLSAVQTVELRPRVGGYIESVRFAEGGLVKAGQVLFQLDARTYEAAFARAKADLTQAEERLALAETKYARGEKLLSDKVISESDFDVLKADRAEGRARVESARAAVRAAEIDLHDTKVRAPIGGRVGQALVTEGNLVSGGTAGATLLTTIVSVDPFHVYFDVDEPTYLRFASAGPTGRQADGRVHPVPVRLALLGEEGFPWEAKLDFLSNRVDPVTGTARARAVLSNPSGKLTAGLFARVRLETGAARPTVLIDETAVGTDQLGRYVLVMRPDASLEQRRVELGAAEGRLRVVRKGLAPGERIVLKGLARPGAKVTPKLVAMAQEVTRP
ncbi:efflux RND transporter periplasmic adaptor subunit [Pyxidicoccus fallax]|uniref:Efflux RND transporter periplasmic adaptor subunit n=1 Tax=Pyxidicoccus fallax TaxID=394095 RepID=A0A848LY39_9BACT|nr:efflux RND transporter periplasmic adaptor subunit [Pyxidicoccus fallax]NMO22283.1 efflux RND transporter periplasmic adaptor subunit [Pyxidicoccus fallax]NPC83913.1 efflux RND transporter periplasmic adaptor subunit [Pyxidicoccus fallax]